MSSFIDGFSDELVKVAVVKKTVKAGKSLLKFLFKHPYISFGAIGGVTGGISGAARASATRAARRSIRPSKAYYTNFNRALRIPRRMTKVQRERLFRHARAVPGRYRK